MSRSDHFVQFYEDDTFLVEAIAGFVAAGLRAGEAVIVVATADHRRALEEQLRADGLGPTIAQAKGRYFSLDAAETLSRFMVNGFPDEHLFRQTVGPIVSLVTRAGFRLRCFGEMVALLWADGNQEAAIRLEDLWNKLNQAHPFSLFCAYPMKGFCGEANREPFAHVCCQHTRVIPAESYAHEPNADQRLRTISLLQQKALSLESEIAGRRKTETVLDQREQELADCLENATDGIHQLARDGTILWANKAELDLLGYGAGEYIGRSFTEFHADPDAAADLLARLRRGEKLRDYEARMKHRDGSIRHVSINSSVYCNDSGLVHARCFTRDITERKRAAELLEQAVAARTAQLRETIDELETFSCGISHDLRSPLRVMNGYARSLLEDYGSKLDADAIVRLERIQRASLRLDLLVRDILAYSKVSNGCLELTPVALKPLIDDTISGNPEFERMRNRITIEQPLHTVIGYEAWLVQILTNLIGNALKFVPPDSLPAVRIRSEAANGHVRVWVSDRGIGIHPDHHDRIFQMFSRLHSDGQYEGTGIGLAIVKKAVTRMGGETGFHSVPGRGSDFWFSLPRAE